MPHAACRMICATRRHAVRYTSRAAKGVQRASLNPGLVMPKFLLVNTLAKLTTSPSIPAMEPYPSPFHTDDDSAMVTRPAHGGIGASHPKSSSSSPRRSRPRC